MHPIDRKTRIGFTLIETVTALTLASVAGVTILASLATTTGASQDSLDRVVALGLAQQLLDEVSGMKYVEAPGGEYDTPMGPGSPEISAGARKQFDDIDDYNGIATTPPTDRWGIRLGTDDGKQSTRNTNFQIPATFLNGWKQQVDISYVSDSNLSTVLTSGSSNHRLIRVRIIVTETDGSVTTLADLSRVVANVPAG
ncbi:MAG: hypothetical protein K8U03_10245 [Planctomycetia bacterium]|nr:hypothetical protein [Planctomycetia bacterium]